MSLKGKGFRDGKRGCGDKFRVKSSRDVRCPDSCFETLCDKTDT